MVSVLFATDLHGLSRTNTGLLVSKVIVFFVFLMQVVAAFGLFFNCQLSMVNCQLLIIHSLSWSSFNPANRVQTIIYQSPLYHSIVLTSHRPSATGHFSPPSLSDLDRDGLPDGAELIDETDRSRFRRWFVAIAESQFYSVHSQWPNLRWDCTGLICFAYKEALKSHDHQWLKGFKYLTDPAVPDLHSFRYPEIPLIKTNLFRTSPGPFKPGDLEDNTFQPIATAQVLLEHNCRFLGKELDDEVMEGDLLFYRYFVDERMVYHTMILVKKYWDKNTAAPEGIVVYHTGPDGSAKGEVRKLSISALNRHPDDIWHVKPNNPHFLGFYRFNLLDFARGALFEKTAPLDPLQKLLLISQKFLEGPGNLFSKRFPGRRRLEVKK